MNDKIFVLCSGARGTLQISPQWLNAIIRLSWEKHCFGLCCDRLGLHKPLLSSQLSACAVIIIQESGSRGKSTHWRLRLLVFFLPASCSIIHRRQINTHSLWFVSRLPRLVYDNNMRSYAIKLIPLYCVIQVFSSLQCMRKGALSVGYRTKSMAAFHQHTGENLPLWYYDWDNNTVMGWVGV